jgi:hypothetical protein
MRERWLEAIGITYRNASEREVLLKRLYRSLAVQPINYTDLFVLRVRANIPQEANREATLLANLFIQWDKEQVQRRTERLARILESRLAEIRRSLDQTRRRLRNYDRAASLSLSGSAEEKGLETDAHAGTGLYNELITEQDAIRRQLNSESLQRSDLLAPESMPGTPVYSRLQLLAVALTGALFVTFGVVMLIESQDEKIYRVGDLCRVISPARVIRVPNLDLRSMPDAVAVYLDPIVEAIEDLTKTKSTIVVQVVSPGDGHGKTTVSKALAKKLEGDYKTCILPRFRGQASPETEVNRNGDAFSKCSSNVSTLVRNSLVPLETNYQICIVDRESSPGAVMGTFLSPVADISCIVLASGLASFHSLEAYEPRLREPSEQKIYFVLNRYSEVLPSWIGH